MCSVRTGAGGAGARGFWRGSGTSGVVGAGQRGRRAAPLAPGERRGGVRRRELLYPAPANAAAVVLMGALAWAGTSLLLQLALATKHAAHSSINCTPRSAASWIESCLHNGEEAVPDGAE
ncbi:hypothetical protein ACP70R_032881 [Stipagrostis hirtigluma subsp. patula]